MHTQDTLILPQLSTDFMLADSVSQTLWSPGLFETTLLSFPVLSEGAFVNCETWVD